jgi:diguanylate cyclase (GGDEF)-like protein
MMTRRSHVNPMGQQHRRAGAVPFSLVPSRDRHAVEDRISVVRLAVLLALIPGVWFGVIPVGDAALDQVIILLGSYVVLLALAHRRVRSLHKADMVIVLDLFVITAMVEMAGDTYNPFIYLYYLTILEAAARLNIRQAIASSLAMAAMIILVSIRGGYTEMLQTTGFRLGAVIAGGFFLALVLGLSLQEYRGTRDRLQGLEFSNELATQLSGKLRTESVVASLADFFQQATDIDRVAAFLPTEDGGWRCVLSRGEPLLGQQLSPDLLGLPSGEGQDGELVVQPHSEPAGQRGGAIAAVRLSAGGHATAWLCGVGQARLSSDEPVHRLVKAIAVQGASALEAASLYEKTQQLAATDALTGLANRRSFLERFASELAGARRTGRVLSIVLVDVNDFKVINDTYGHNVGDDAIVRLSSLLGENVRASDLAGRFGGDEFALMFPGTSRDVVNRIMERLAATPMAVSNGPHELRVRFSWGATTFPEDGETPDTLLRMADQRLYRMKHLVADRGLTGIA